MGLCQDLSHGRHSTLSLANIIETMAGANEAELREAFKLFDADGDGMISAEELVTLISKVGGQMADAEAKALIHAADKDGNMGIDFGEFAKFWEALHGTMRERSELSLESWTQTTVATSRETRWWQLSPRSSKETRWRKPRKPSRNWMWTRMAVCRIQSSSWS